jgi:hypothetical protein
MSCVIVRELCGVSLVGLTLIIILRCTVKNIYNNNRVFYRCVAGSVIRNVATTEKERPGSLPSLQLLPLWLPHRLGFREILRSLISRQRDISQQAKKARTTSSTPVDGSPSWSHEPHSMEFGTAVTEGRC